MMEGLVGDGPDNVDAATDLAVEALIGVGLVVECREPASSAEGLLTNGVLRATPVSCH
jgi:hypothetical protein